MNHSKSLKFLWLAISLAFCCVILGLQSGAYAMQMERNFPEGIKRGRLSTTDMADIVIEGKLRRTAISLRIYTEDNMTVTPASLYVKNVIVYYLEDDTGDIIKIWILSAEEAKMPMPKKTSGMPA